MESETAEYTQNLYVSNNICLGRNGIYVMKFIDAICRRLATESKVAGPDSRPVGRFYRWVVLSLAPKSIIGEALWILSLI